MNRRLHFLLAAALAILLFILIVIRPRSPSPSPDRRTDSSTDETPKGQSPGVLPEEAKTDPETPTPVSKQLITTWSEVPCRYASFPAVIGGAGNAHRMSYASLQNTLHWEAKCLEGKLEAIDKETRWLGVIQTLDSVLVTAVGLPTENRWNCAKTPREYFPVDFGLPVIPVDPAEAERTRDRLLTLLANKDFTSLVTQVPESHRFAGLEEALATRAISMLGAWGADARTRAVLQAELAGDAPASRKAAALNSLIMQGETADARSWLASIRNDGPLLSAALEGLVPPDELAIPDPSAVNEVAFMAAHSGRGRELDDVLLDLFYSSSTPGLRTSLAASLAGRVDNERVRHAAMELLRTGEPEAVVAFLRKRPNITGNIEYSTALKELLKSTDARVVNWAIVGLSSSGDPEAWRSIAALLQHSNRGLAVVAVSNLGKSGRGAKTECRSLIRAALAARKSDPEFENLANMALMILN